MPARGNWFESFNLQLFFDYMAEWLRRWTANPLGSARAGSNPVVVVIKKIKSKSAFIAQLGERQTEDLKVAGSSPAEGILNN